MPSFLAYRPGLMSHLESILIQIVPGGPAGISIFFHFLGSPKWPRMVPPGPRGPGGVFLEHFWPILGPQGGKKIPYFSPLGALGVGGMGEAAKYAWLAHMTWVTEQTS